MSLIDLDFMNHLIKVSSEFRAFLQRSSSSRDNNARQEGPSQIHGWAPVPSVTIPRAISPAGIEENRIVDHTGMRQQWSSNTVPDTRLSQVGPDLSPPLNPRYGAGAAAPLPHPVVCSDAAVPAGPKDEPRTLWRPRHSAGEWRRSIFSRGMAIVRRLFKFSSA